MASPSHLLELPGELRNQIYEDYASVMTIQMHKGCAIPPALARTCRKIREELMSTLHRCLFHTAALEARVTDWDFHDVLVFLERLKAHNTGHIRHLTIYIDVRTPATNYSLGRLDWCKNARFDMAWYNEDPLRQVQLISDRSTPIRLKIGEQWYDVRHVVRFPPSLVFTEKHRRSDPTWFQNYNMMSCRMFGARCMALNYQLERALEGAPSRPFVDRYWGNAAAWNERLRRIREGAEHPGVLGTIL